MAPSRPVLHVTTGPPSLSNFQLRYTSPALSTSDTNIQYSTPTFDMMEGYPETALEKIFQKVEEESERRAQACSPEHEQDVMTSGMDNIRAKERGSGRISMSQFGQLPEMFNRKDVNRPPPSIVVSVISSHSTFYEADAANSSVSSFESAESTRVADDLEDTVNVTQVQQIAGRRQSISRAIESVLPRRLSRARSSNTLTVSIAEDANVVIGVSVERSVVDVPDEAEATTSGATVSAPGALRSPASSTFNMAYYTSSGKGWVTKANLKGITQKLRRRSKSNEVGDNSMS